ncbi:MAG: hypothetical protein ACRDQU_13665 [Pseudonocardiaceae bacterium]
MAKRAVTVLLAVVAAWLVSLGLGTATALADDPPVMTESFESGSGLPAGWTFVQFTPRNSTATIVSGAAADGTHFLRIVSSKLNHARLVAPVRVTPNMSYRFHAMAKASGVSANAAAAVLGVDGQVTATDSVRTDTQWRPLDLYVKSGPRTTIDLTMGLGNFGGLNLGMADFDAVTVTQISAIPNGATVVDLASVAAAPAAPASTSQHDLTRAIWGFVGILVVVGIGATVYVMRRGDPVSAPEANTTPRADVEPESNQAGTTGPPGDLYADTHRGGDSKPDRAD